MSPAKILGRTYASQKNMPSLGAEYLLQGCRSTGETYRVEGEVKVWAPIPAVCSTGPGPRSSATNFLLIDCNGYEA